MERAWAASSVEPHSLNDKIDMLLVAGKRTKATKDGGEGRKNRTREMHGWMDGCFVVLLFARTPLFPIVATEHGIASTQIHLQLARRWGGWGWLVLRTRTKGEEQDKENKENTDKKEVQEDVGKGKENKQPSWRNQAPRWKRACFTSPEIQEVRSNQDSGEGHKMEKGAPFSKKFLGQEGLCYSN